MSVQPLGTLARTHTCGELTAADAGKDVVLLGWVHRVRDLGGVMFFDIRDRYGITQAVVRDEALDDVAKRLRPEFVVGIIGRVDLRAKEAINPKIKTGEIEVAAARHPAAERREDAAVPDQRGHAGLGRDAAALPLSRPAPPAAAAEHDPAAQDDVRGAPLLRRAELPRDRDADPDQVDAGRGARLPGAEPRAPGRVLRAAAVAADLQADPDDRRAWTATSRSRSASATRTCAPTASPSSPRSTSRSASRPRTSSSPRSSR